MLASGSTRTQCLSLLGRCEAVRPARQRRNAGRLRGSKVAAPASAAVCARSRGGLRMSHSVPSEPANQITRRPRPPRTGRRLL